MDPSASQDTGVREKDRSKAMDILPSAMELERIWETCLRISISMEECTYTCMVIFGM